MLRRTWPRALVGGLLVAIVGAGFLVMVNAQTTTTTIYACVNSNGITRIVASRTDCGRNEYLTSWSNTGPQGVKGDKGDPGEPGLAAEGNYVADITCYLQETGSGSPTLVYTLLEKFQVWASCTYPTLPDERGMTVWFTALAPLTVGVSHDTEYNIPGWTPVATGAIYDSFAYQVGGGLPYLANGTITDGTSLWTYSLGYGVKSHDPGWVTFQIIPTKLPSAP